MLQTVVCDTDCIPKDNNIRGVTCVLHSVVCDIDCIPKDNTITGVNLCVRVSGLQY